jgi:glycosyltransferase involved in cell wall biosynthesis
MEWTSVKFSDYLICDSEGITNYVKENYHYKKKIFTIEYGAYINSFLNINNSQTKDVLSEYGLEKNSYHLVVSRLEPENNVDMIIDGYQQSSVLFPLVIVGNLNSTAYVETLTKNESKKIIFLGGIYNKDTLSILRANALSYLHGHSVGGTNPSLLEAMGSENLCFCHDNIFNKKTVGQNGLYFKNTEELNSIFLDVEESKNIQQFTQMKNGVLQSIKEYYNWEVISKKYLQAFQDILKR